MQAVQGVIVVRRGQQCADAVRSRHSGQVGRLARGRGMRCLQERLLVLRGEGDSVRREHVFQRHQREQHGRMHVVPPPLPKPAALDIRRRVHLRLGLL